MKRELTRFGRVAAVGVPCQALTASSRFARAAAMALTITVSGS